MQLNDREKGYIYDMIKYCEEIIAIIKNENHESFSKNRLMQLALERLIEIVGEAANHISMQTQLYSSRIPWSSIIGLRNKIAHDYGEILTDRIWLISTINIPELLKVIKEYQFI